MTSKHSLHLQLNWTCPSCGAFNPTDGITSGKIKCEKCPTTLKLDKSLAIKKVSVLGDLIDLPEVRATR